MVYTYEAEAEKFGDGDWVVSVPAFPGCFGSGRTIRKACESAATSLKLFITDKLDDGSKLPAARFHNPPRTVLSVEVTEQFVEETRCYTTKQAAEELGVTPGRVSQLLKAGRLEAAIIGGKRMVTIASVERRLREQQRVAASQS